MVGGRVEFSFVVDRRSHLGEIAPGDTHKPEAISPRPTALVFERFLPSLILWLSPN